MASLSLLTLFLLAIVGSSFQFVAANSDNDVIDERKSYDGYKVLEVVPIDQQTIRFLRRLMLDDIELDFWSEPKKLNAAVKFMVPPHRLSSVVRHLEQADIRHVVRQHNVKDVLEPLWREMDSRSSDERRIFNIEDFNTLPDINGWLNQMTFLCRADVTCQVVNLGNSFGGNAINSFRITKAGTGRRAYYIDSTIHAREWITTATTLKIINALVLGTNADAIRLVDSFDWFIVPVVNPDGYLYTWNNDRYWRKNRKPNGQCYGTDLNRNYDYEWGTDGVSHQPCSNLFCGTSPASEPETVVIQNELRRLAPTLKGAITLHSYGEMWMFPWGFTVDHAGEVCARTTDHAEQMVLSDKVADAIQDTYGITYWLRGNGCEEIYETSGSTDDFAKGRAGIKWSFCVELRGGENDDFVLDKSNITPSFNEFWNGLVVMVNNIP